MYIENSMIFMAWPKTPTNGKLILFCDVRCVREYLCVKTEYVIEIVR